MLTDRIEYLNIISNNYFRFIAAALNTLLAITLPEGLTPTAAVFNLISARHSKLLLRITWQQNSSS